MINKVDIPIREFVAPQIEQTDKSEPGSGAAFAKDLESAIKGVRENLTSADEVAADALTGQGGGPHEVMIAMTRADLSFRLATQVRNKVVDAYREIMRLTM